LNHIEILKEAATKINGSASSLLKVINDKGQIDPAPTKIQPNRVEREFVVKALSRYAS
jgi:hypothetical protein